MKKLLLVVDFQNDFVSGSLGFESANQLENKIVSKILNYRKNGFDVAFTFDTHSENYLITQEGTKLPIEHCISGTAGWQLYGEVSSMIKDEDKRFNKPGFGSPELLIYLQNNKYDEIELVGLVTNICVIANAIIAKTALPEAKIVVDASCTDSFDKTLHEKALDVMEGLQMEVTNRN